MLIKINKALFFYVLPRQLTVSRWIWIPPSQLIEEDEERKLGTFNEKHMATEVAIDALGKE